VAPDGTTTAVTSDHIQAEPLRQWQSPHSGAEYPLAWRLRVHQPDLELRITTPVDDQEMTTSRTTGVTYWEGSVTAEGRMAGQDVKGRGYMELTGQAQAMDDKL
jgi:predicted secreted hydrolase